LKGWISADWNLTRRLTASCANDSEATDLRVPLVYQPTVNSADVGANAYFNFLGNFAETGAEIVPRFR